MRKHLNRIKRIEADLGLDDHSEQWLVWKQLDGTVNLTTITAPKPQDTKKTLTAGEFESFRDKVGDDQMILVEWTS